MITFSKTIKANTAVKSNKIKEKVLQLVISLKQVTERQIPVEIIKCYSKVVCLKFQDSMLTWSSLLILDVEGLKDGRSFFIPVTCFNKFQVFGEKANF